MELIRVHIAELVIADDAADVATADAVTDRATAAGHAVVARVVVKDDESTIRAQLVKWIADPEIDIVIATGPHESKAANAALKPLITASVPGFTDLFRWLAFQEIGASAMQSTAEAAKCGATFVFVVPASAKVVRDVMDKIINPQLDPATRPKNLVTELPRLKPLADAAEAVVLAKLQAEQQAKSVPDHVEGGKTEAVPTTIGPEKTEAGIGGQLRSPARRSPTGQHVVRKEPTPDVTRLADRAQLERDLARTTAPDHDSPTRPSVDLRKLLPRVPPGADDIIDSDELGGDDFANIAPQPLARAKPSPTEQPAGTRKPVQIPPLPTLRSAESHKAFEDVTDELPPVRSATIVTKAAPPPSSERPSASVVKPGKPATTASRPTPPVLIPPTRVAKPADRPTPLPKAAPSATPVLAAASPGDTSHGPRPMAVVTPTNVATAPGDSTSRPTPPALTSPPGLIVRPRRHQQPELDVVSIAELAARARDEDAESSIVSKKPVDDSADTAATTARKNRGPGSDAAALEASDETAASSSDEVALEPRDEQAPTSGDIATADEGGAESRTTAASESATASEPGTESVSVRRSREIHSAPPPPPPARKRAPTAPPPLPQRTSAGRANARLGTEELSEDDVVGGAAAIVAVATGATDVASARARARRPTEPPSPRDTFDDLPRGKFVYPVHRSTGRRILMGGVLALLAAAGGVAFVKFFVMDKQTEVASSPAAVAAVGDAAIATPADATQVAIAEPDAQVPEIVIDVSGSGDSGTGSARGSNTGHPNIETSPNTVHTSPNTGHTSPNTGHTSPNTGHTSPNTGHTHPRSQHVAAVVGPTGTAEQKSDNTAHVALVPPADPTCDEVSCVLEKYARPCCARYKPADTGFKPIAGVPDELDKSMVRSGVEKVKPRVIACGEKNAAKGAVKVSLTVGPDGVVKDASVVESPAPDLGTCVATALRSAQFTKTKMGGSFTYPFVF